MNRQAFSPVARELAAMVDAARTAGLQALLCVRPGNPVPPPGGGDTVRGFDEIE